MLCSSFQRLVHVEGLRMSRWDNVDVLGPDRTLSRTIYSEPNLRVPKFLAKFARKSQAYHEYSEFDPRALSRRTRVVPVLGAHVMDFIVTERYVDRPDSKSCVVISNVSIRVKTRLFRNLLERWILEQSETKVSQRDAYVLRALGEREYKDIVSTVDDDPASENVGEINIRKDSARERFSFAIVIVGILGGVALLAKRPMR